MRVISTTAVVAALACASLGCEGEEASATSPTTMPSATAASAPTSTAGPGAGYSDDELPVPADFEEEMEEAITADNYKQKLAEIEAELGLPAADDGGEPQEATAESPSSKAPGAQPVAPQPKAPPAQP